MKKILILLLLIANVSFGQTINEINNILSNRADADITTTAGSALNTNIISGDFSNYKSIKVNLAGTFVATWTVQFCNEPTFTVPLTGQVYSENTSTWIAGTGTAAAQFNIPTNQARYVRIRVTAFTSGSIVATASGSGADIPIALSEGAFNTRVPTVAQKTGALSMPVVPASNYFESQPVNYIVNVAITGATVGQTLQRVYKNNGGTVAETWYNISNSPSTIITAPTTANITNNDISVLNSVQLSDKRAANKYYIASSTFTGGSVSTVFAIRNTNTFAVRISSLELSAQTNVTGTASLNIPWVASIGTGTTSITAGSALSCTKVTGNGTYAVDATITAVAFYTSAAATTTFPVAIWSQDFSSYQAQSGIATVAAKSNFDWAKGLIIPAGGLFTIVSTGFTALPVSTYPSLSMILTEL